MKRIFLLLVELIYFCLFQNLVFAQADEEKPDPESPVQDNRRTVKLSPQLRSLGREKRVPTIPIETIQHFLTHPQLLTTDEINNSGYIIENSDGSLLSTVGDQIYVSGLDNQDPIGNPYIIVRPGQIYHGPQTDKTEEILAQAAVYLGEATLKNQGDPATLMITSARQEIRKGDLLLPLQERGFVEDFHPHSPQQLTDAYIIAVTDGTSLIGKYQVVVINKGFNDSIERGHLLAVIKSGPKITITRQEDYEDNVTLPQQKIGSLLVFRVFDTVSYALVMTSSLPISLFDEVTIP
ncbi:MAG: LysM domain-containing protein [Thioploca sp.]|nr:LysM domain-containing protein [Thioploca sp.]